jgi:hypothetical protein
MITLRSNGIRFIPNFVKIKLFQRLKGQTSKNAIIGTFSYSNKHALIKCNNNIKKE